MWHIALQLISDVSCVILALGQTEIFCMLQTKTALLPPLIVSLISLNLLVTTQTSPQTYYMFEFLWKSNIKSKVQMEDKILAEESEIETVSWQTLSFVPKKKVFFGAFTGA